MLEWSLLVDRHTSLVHKNCFVTLNNYIQSSTKLGRFTYLIRFRNINQVQKSEILLIKKMLILGLHGLLLNVFYS